MDRFANMQTFVAVVDAGTITAAADRLAVAKSAVSRRLAELEQHLGVQLLRRTTRRLDLTDTGRSYYQRCQRILEDVRETEAAVSTEHRALRGRIRISVPMTFGMLHLRTAISEFLAANPAVSFDLDLGDRQVDLMREGFDLAIRISQLADSSLIARRIAPIRTVVCASSSYWDEHGRPATPDELARHACLHYTLTAAPGTWRYRYKDGSEGSVEVPGRLRANNGDVLRDFAVSGLGVAILPTFIVYRAIERGELEPVLTEIEWSPLTAYAVYPQSRHLSTRIRAFVAFLGERFGDAPYWDRCLQNPRAPAS